MDRDTVADLLDNLVGMVDDTQGNNYDTALKMGIEALRAERHGKWLEHKDYPGLAYLCSECNLFITDRSFYCPNCGAKMEVEHEL